MVMVKRIRFENKGAGYHMRCNYCHKAAKELYAAQFEDGGDKYLLHPGQCFRLAQANFAEKKAKGIIPTVQTESETFEGNSEIVEESTNDNILQ